MNKWIYNQWTKKGKNDGLYYRHQKQAKNAPFSVTTMRYNMTGDVQLAFSNLNALKGQL